MKKLVLVLALLFSTLSFAKTKITFHEGGDNLYIVEINSDDSNLNAQSGLELIAQESAKKCGNKPSQLGKYKFKKNGPIDTSGQSSFRMVQQLFCGDIPTSGINQQATQDISPAKKETLKNEAIKVTNVYLDALAIGNYKKAYSFFTDNQKQNQPFEAFTARQSHLPSQGNKINETVWNTTVYIDPPNSPQKGIFIATDFERNYENIPIYCGYLVWYVQDNSLKLLREEINVIDKKLFVSMKSDEINKIKQSFRCKP